MCHSYQHNNFGFICNICTLHSFIFKHNHFRYERKQGICVIVLGNILKLHNYFNEQHNSNVVYFYRNALLLTLKQCCAYRCIKMFCNSYIWHKSDIKLTYIIKRGMLEVMQLELLHCKLSQFYDVIKHTARGLLYYLIKRLLKRWRFVTKKRY